jgi:hypothetical protein
MVAEHGLRTTSASTGKSAHGSHESDATGGAASTDVPVATMPMDVEVPIATARREDAADAECQGDVASQLSSVYMRCGVNDCVPLADGVRFVLREVLWDARRRLPAAAWHAAVTKALRAWQAMGSPEMVSESASDLDSRCAELRAAPSHAERAQPSSRPSRSMRATACVRPHRFLPPAPQALPSQQFGPQRQATALQCSAGDAY